MRLTLFIINMMIGIIQTILWVANMSVLAMLFVGVVLCLIYTFPVTSTIVLFIIVIILGVGGMLIMEKKDG